MEDPRQPAAQPARSRDRGPAPRRLDPPAGKPRALDGGRGRGHRVPPLPAPARGGHGPEAPAALAGLPPRSPGGRRRRPGARPPPARLPRQPGLRDGARRPRHPGPARLHPARPARVGDRRGERGPRGGERRVRIASIPVRDGGQPDHRGGRPAAGGRAPAGRPLGGRPDPRALGCGAVHRPRAEPPPAPPGARRGGPRIPARRGPEDLGLLRELHGARGPRIAAGQLPGGPRTQGGAPDLADQHRHGSPLGALRP